MEDDVEIPAEVEARLLVVEAEIERQYGPDFFRVSNNVTRRALFVWERLIGEIGDYRGSMAEEYMNEVACRGQLHEVATMAFQMDEFAVLKWLLPTLEALDDKYRAKTTVDYEMFFHQTDLFPAYWWECRIPDDDGLLVDFHSEYRRVWSDAQLKEHRASFGPCPSYRP